MEKHLLITIFSIFLFNYFYLMKIISNNNFINIDFKVEVKKFISKLIIGLILILGILELLQIISNESSVVELFSQPFKNIYSILAWLTILIYEVIIVFWIFLLNGAEQLVRYKIIFRKIPSSVIGIKTSVIIIIIFQLIVMIINQFNS